MPLPPALLSKLSKRGIVAPSKSSTKPVKREDCKGFVYCPNKVNIYHTCNGWCEMNWRGHPMPDTVYAKNMQKLLFKYPLSSNWTEIFDKAVGRYYYWNIENDMVSWLPPKHPKTNPSKSAAKLREQRMNAKKILTNEKYEDKHNSEEKEHKRYSRFSSKRENERETEERVRKEDKYGNKRSRKDNNSLDPMDPASYSDIAPGTWSSGLENNRTYADNTASGELFQQRPYPSPGEVLSANKEKYGKKN